MSTLTTYRPQAMILAAWLPQIMKNRGLDPRVIARYDLWTGTGGLVWLTVVLDTSQMDKPEKYLHPQTAHHISTVLSQKAHRKIHVFASNSDGARYGIPMSALPKLPKMLSAPAWRKGVAQIGRSLKGEITAGWHHDEGGIGHVLTASMNRFGKSTLLKNLAHQALQEGFQLILIDPRGATFAPLRGHAQVLAYTGNVESSVDFLATHLLGHMDNRAPIHQQHGVDKFEKLPDGTLPRLVIFIDEYTEILKRADGKRKALSDAVVTMAFGAPKYGVHLIVAGHYFQQDEADRLKDQFITKIVFRLESKEAARMLLDTDLPTRLEEKGRAMTNRWGLIQTYYTELETVPQGDGLTETERGLIARIKTEYGGLATYPTLEELGYRRRAADKLREDWVRRGLARLDPTQNNALVVLV